MEKLRTLLVSGFILAGSIASCLAIPADLTAPQATLGVADREGKLLLSYDVRQIDFGDGVKLPLRFTFASGNFGESVYGWNGWTVGALEASAYSVRDDLYQVTLLCGKSIYFNKLLGASAGLNNYVSSDGEWTGHLSGYTFTIERWDGWQLVFKYGLIDSLRTDKNVTLRWERSYLTGPVKRIYRPSTNATALEVSYGTGGKVTALNVNGDTYPITLSAGRLTRIDLPDSTSWQFGWQLPSGPLAPQEVILSVTDRHAITESYKYKTNGTLMNDGVWAYTVNEPPTGTVVYDRPAMARQRLTTTEVETLFYSANNSVSARLESNGLLVRTYVFKSQGKLNDKVRKIEHIWQGVTTTVYQATYDEVTGRLIRELDANEHATEYAYENHPGASEFAPAKKITVTDALGHSRVSEYDTEGNLIKTTDPMGVKRSYVYDARARLTQVKNNADVVVSKFTWNNDDQVLTSEDAQSNKTEFEYQAHYGRSLVKKIISPLGAVTQFTYDAKANLIQTQLPTGQLTTLSPNARNLTETQTDAMGGQTTYEYDSKANRTKITDALGFSTQIVYDDLNLPKEFTDALGATAKYAWNAKSGMNSIEDKRAQVSQFEYDRNSVRTKRIDPDSGQEVVTYDPVGNRTSVQPRGGVASVTRTFDAADQLTGKTWANGLGATGSATFTHDAANRPAVIETTTATGATFTQTYGFDTEGRVNAFTQNTRAVSYGYDANGRVNSIGYPAGFAVTYHYNADGKLTDIKKAGTTLATYAYDGVGRLSTRTLSNGVVTTYGYDGLDRVNSIILSNAGLPLWSNSCGYDAVGNRRWTQAPNGKGDAYAYDGLSQLTGAKYQATSPNLGYIAASSPVATASFSYDAAGNRTSVTDAGATTAYTVNAINQYTLLVLGGVNTVPVYNAQGDLLTHQGWAFTYDAEAHVIAATNGGTTVQYEFAGNGDRVGRKIGTQVSWYLNSGGNLIESYDVGSSTAKSYIHEPGLNQPLAAVDASGAVTFFHQDFIGNVVALSDAGGSLIEEYRYDAWGKATAYQGGVAVAAGTAPASAFLFTGHQYDPETGLHFARARSYSAALGRWLSRDPVEELGGINLYTYVENNGVNLTDETGLYVTYGKGGDASYWKAWKKKFDRDWKNKKRQENVDGSLLLEG